MRATSPMRRAFLTYANWSEGLRGFVGGVAYLNRTNGLTYIDNRIKVFLTKNVDRPTND